MRALRLACFAALSVVGLRYAHVYYSTYQFNGRVHRALQKTHSEELLKEVILKEAGTRRLPIEEQDISVTTSDSVLRVSIEYKVPVNYYVFRHVLKFRSVASDFSQ